MKKPSVIVLDTDPSTFELAEAVVEHVSPGSADLDLLKEADLILVDFKIDDWPSATNLDIPLIARPVDGLAVAHSIRRLLHKSDDHKPPAVALITNDYGLAAKPLPPETRPHILARLNGIEWVYRKGQDPGATILSLGQACNDTLYAIAGAAPEQDKWVNLCAYLGVTDEARRDLILDELRYCSPPLHQLLRWEDGLLVLRWLVHRILPYPTMLVGDSYLAQRAQCEPEGLIQALDSSFPTVLSPTRYAGACAAMFERRYWRTFLEAHLFEVLKQEANSPDIVRAYIQSHVGVTLVPVQQSIEGVASDGSYGRTLVRASVAREKMIDDWPPFAARAMVLNG